MATSLPLTHRCRKCGEWYHNAHVCPNPADLRPRQLTEEDVRRIVREELIRSGAAVKPVLD